MKTALLLLVLSATAAYAQVDRCAGLKSVKDGAKPIYPAIAKAAHVEGNVTLLVTFATTGEADAVEVVTGPLMLQQGAMNYAKTWRANKYSGPRTCQVEITYVAPSASAKCKRRRGSVRRDSAKRTDARHVIVKGSASVCSEEFA